MSAGKRRVHAYDDPWFAPEEKTRKKKSKRKDAAEKKKAPEPEAAPPAPSVSPPLSAEQKKAKLRKRAVDLIARAAHESTGEEEARTSALVAVRMIHAEGLLSAPETRHPLLERLEALDDQVLDELGGVVEMVLDDPKAMSAANGGAQAARWRNEAKHLQRKLEAFGGSLHWILQAGHKFGLVERPGFCGFCKRPLQRGQVIVWKRRRLDSAHYTCCVEALQQGAP